MNKTVDLLGVKNTTMDGSASGNGYLPWGQGLSYSTWWLDLTVAGVVFLLLIISRLVLLKILSGTASRSLSPLPTCLHRDWTETLAQAPGDVIIYTAGFVIAVVVLFTTSVLQHPLSPQGHSSLLHYGLALGAGTSLYQLVAGCLLQQSHCDGLAIVAHVIATSTYVTIDVTLENSMLGVMVLVFPFPLALYALERVYDLPSSETKRTAVYKYCPTVCSVVCLLASAVFMLIAPAIGVVHATVTESVALHLSLWSTCNYCMAVVCMALFGLWFVLTRAYSLYKGCRTARVNDLGERRPLVSVAYDVPPPLYSFSITDTLKVAPLYTV